MAPNLDTLPVELIQRIVSVGEFTSALNLLRVNHALRAACNDKFVFKRLAQIAHLFKYATTWDSAALFEGKTLRETKELAWITDKAANLEWKPDSLMPLFHWLPQATALRHPCALQTDPFHIAQMLKESRMGEEIPEGFRSLTFFIVAAILERRTLYPLSDNSRQPINSKFYCHATSTLENTVLSAGDDATYPIDQICDILDTAPWHYSVLIPIAFMLGFLKDPICASKLPVPSKIPFGSFMEMPQLLHSCEDADDLFPLVSTDDSVVSEFLGSGEWIGYYSYRGLQRFDPPMHSIHFEMREEDGERVIESTTGDDGVGRFTLLGALSRKSGRPVLQMIKTYTHGVVIWDWEAWITPFGVVGVWGTCARDMVNGHFWLWKKDWTQEQSLTSQ